MTTINGTERWTWPTRSTTFIDLAHGSTLQPYKALHTIYMICSEPLYIYIVYPCVTIIPFILSGWWFGTFFPYIGNVIIPTDELIFFRWVQTTKQILLVVNHHICLNHLSFPQRGLSRAAGGGARVLRRWGRVRCGVLVKSGISVTKKEFTSDLMGF